MARPQKFFARTSHEQRIYPLKLMKGETEKVEIDWGQILGERATTIVDTSFDNNGSTIVGIDTPLITGNITSAMFTGSDQGSALIKNTVTLANDEVLIRHWYVTISDPTISARLSDYQVMSQ